MMTSPQPPTTMTATYQATTPGHHLAKTENWQMNSSTKRTWHALNLESARITTTDYHALINNMLGPFGRSRDYRRWKGC